MPVIAIINRKGGSGKSTLATHLAAYAANAGHSVMLGDIDLQQSSKTWLGVRNRIVEDKRPPIQTWAHSGSVNFRAPPGVKLVILDTQGGLMGFELAKVIMAADAVLIPVNNSMFDMKSASDCIDELKKLPKIANGACKVGIVGMRIDSRTTGAVDLSGWAQRRGVEFVAHLRSARIYVSCIEQGLTIFDLPQDKVHFDLLQWRPILSWLSVFFEDSLQLSVKQPAQANMAAASFTEKRNAPNAQTAVKSAVTHPLRPISTAPPPVHATSESAPLKKSLFASIMIPEFLKKK